MFADQTPGDETTTLVSLLPVIGWALLGVLVLVAVWRLSTRYGLADRAHGLLVMRSRTVLKSTAPTREAHEEPVEAHAPGSTGEPAPTGEAPTPPAPGQPSLPDAPMEEAPAWLSRVLVAIAAVPTLLALPWAAWAVAHLLPVPLAVAVPLGILFDVLIVGSVLVALLVPWMSRPASMLGWLSALAAAAAIATHVGWGGALIFAVTPLFSKALWGLLITIRRQQAALAASREEAERRKREAGEEAARQERVAREAEESRQAAELSDELTFEQQRQIADKRREARFKLDMAAAERELERAESEAEHQKALAEIKRLGEQQREEDREAASVFEQRLRLERQLATLRGESPAFLAVSSGDQGSEVSGEITAKAGFGGVTPTAFGFQRPLDVKALTPEGAAVPFEELSENHQALVKYVHTEKAPTVRGAAREFERDARTIRHWKDKLAELGYDLPIGHSKK